MASAFLLVIALFYQITKNYNGRALLTLVILTVTMGHYLVFDGFGSFSYYGTAALCNLSILIYIWFLPISPMRADIALIQLIAMIAHLAGFAFYNHEIQPAAYSSMVNVLMVLEWLRLMIRTERDVEYGRTKPDRRLRNIRTHVGLGH
jgi:hypothetical protein